MTAYLNGQFLPLDEARISPLDRGFLFADGAYEVVPVYQRRPFLVEAHLQRLQRTLDGIGLPNPHTFAVWRELLQRVLADSAFDDQALYLQVTRGADSKREHAFPSAVSPTVFICSHALVSPSAAQRELGVAALSVADSRWLHCDLKTVALLANVLLRQQAVAVGCAEAIMLRDGLLTEGASSNVFLVSDGVLLTPPADHRILAGISRQLVLELADRNGVPCEIRDVSEAEMRSADELWLTSSTREVLPVSTLDGQAVGSGVPGPLGRQMAAWYRAYREQATRRVDV